MRIIIINSVYYDFLVIKGCNMTSTKENGPVEKKAKTDEDPAITRFREYLRIKTVHPNPDYGMTTRTFFYFLSYKNLLLF